MVRHVVRYNSSSFRFKYALYNSLLSFSIWVWVRERVCMSVISISFFLSINQICSVKLIHKVWKHHAIDNVNDVIASHDIGVDDPR